MTSNKFKKVRNLLYGLYQGLIVIFFSPLAVLILVPIFRLGRLVRKSLKGKPRILWAPLPVVNIHYNSRADRLFGYRSNTLVYNTFRITKKDLFDYNLESIFKNPAFYIILPHLWVFLWAILKYDIFQFYYDGGLLFRAGPAYWLELPLLRLLGKEIIVCAYGADVRTEEITRNLGKYHFYLDYSHEEVINESGPDCEIGRRVNHVLKYASAAISAYDMIEYTPGSRNDIFYWAIDIEEWQPVYETSNERVVILHASNHPKYKGTRFLIETVNRLKEEGHPIEFIQVQGLPNKKAKELYKKADIIAEQFIGGAHGFFAVEAMALGKPVLCYISKSEYLPDWAECPIINTNPDNLYENLVMLIKDKKLREELGRKGRRYVEDVYALEKVGERFDKIYKELW